MLSILLRMVRWLGEIRRGLCLDTSCQYVVSSIYKTSEYLQDIYWSVLHVLGMHGTLF